MHVHICLACCDRAPGPRQDRQMWKCLHSLLHQERSAGVVVPLIVTSTATNGITGCTADLSGHDSSNVYVLKIHMRTCNVQRIQCETTKHRLTLPGSIQHLYTSKRKLASGNTQDAQLICQVMIAPASTENPTEHDDQHTHCEQCLLNFAAILYACHCSPSLQWI